MVAKLLMIFAALVLQARAGDVMPATCPSIDKPSWGVVDCPDGTMPGSMCTLKCDEFYDLAGTTDSSLTVTCMEGGIWSESVNFVCNPIRCFPAQQTPVNGILMCSASNLAQSLCVSFCKQHYDMKDLDSDRTSYIICKDDGDGDEFGQWMPVSDGLAVPPAYPPICEPVECEGSFETIENGKVICSAANFSGNFCVFHCDDGYKFEGDVESVVSTSCRDDDDYDNLGKWTMPTAPECKAMVQTCGPTPRLEGMSFDCDRQSNVPGTQCSAECLSPTESVKRNSMLTCNDGLMWQVTGGGDFPKCTKCDRVDNIQIVALIHDQEADEYQFGLASRLITRLVTVLQRKYKFAPSVRVNTYKTEIDSSVEFFTTSFVARRDKSKIEAIPYTAGNGDIKLALKHANENLNADDSVLVALILLNEMGVYDDEAHRLAEDLRERGVMVFVFSIPQKNRVRTYRREDLVALAGDEEMVYHIGNQRMAEKTKSQVALKINDEALKMGCEKSGNKA